MEHNFQLQAHVGVGFVADFDAGVLIGWVDENNWFKLCAERDPAGTPRIVTVVTRAGASDDCNSWLISRSGIHLRISRSGSTFAMHASEHGDAWTMVRYFTLGLAEGAAIRVGFLAQSPVEDGTTAAFSSIGFSNTALADLRDGT